MTVDHIVKLHSDSSVWVSFLSFFFSLWFSVSLGQEPEGFGLLVDGLSVVFSLNAKYPAHCLVPAEPLFILTCIRAQSRAERKRECLTLFVHLLCFNRPLCAELWV